MNRTVLITGCSSGIGRCLADGLRRQGYNIIVTARKDEDIARLRATGFETVSLDLTDSASIRRAADAVLKISNQKPYAVVNNAAYGLFGAIEDLSREAMRQQFETNVLGVHELTQCLLPAMRKQNEGRIIQISSVLGLVTLPLRGAYCASKYALEALSDALRYELSNTGIKVCLIEPGPIKSGFRSNALNRFNAVIDRDNSHFKEKYDRIEHEPGGSTVSALLSQGPEAVLKSVLHALESERPKSRYYITLSTYVLAILKRVLPSCLLDRILKKMGLI